MTSDEDARSQERHRSSIMAFLGAGAHHPPTPAVAVEALARARRAVTAHQARGEPIIDWLTSEIRLHGIRENAAALAVMEIPEYRRSAADTYALHHPDRGDVLTELLECLT